MSLTITRLTAETLTPHFLTTLAALSEPNLSVAEALPLLAERDEQGTITFIALRNDVVVGTVSLFVEVKFLHAGGLVGHIEDLAVHPDAQGQGIGRALMEHVKQLAIDRGCYKIILSSNEGNTAFYEKFGFHRHEIEMRFDCL
jgi:glucosamine-phosphate N-acetyltransferase